MIYCFAASIDEERQFFLFEVWENEADLKAHFEGSAFRSFFKELPELGASIGYKAWQGNHERYIPPNGRQWW